MGYKHVDAALKAQLPHQDGIEMGTLKLVLVAICQHADNETNHCYPSTRRMARMTHLSKSVVAKAIAYLEGMGCFTNYSKGGGRGSSQYIVDLERLQHWANDFNSVRVADTEDEEESEEGVRHTDTSQEPEARSVHHVDVASTTETQRPRGLPQRPPRDPNQSFDRLAVQSANEVMSAASPRTLPPLADGKPNQSKPDRGVVANQNQPQEQDEPEIWEKRSLIGSVAPL